jgi:ethanolamine-phosphate cytidylyltransferase
MDGCFDMMHSGHYNAIRQARTLGAVLVVGVNSDEEILKNKGPPLLTTEERCEIVRSCKWVGEVVVGSPYAVTEEFLDEHNCNFYAHGDDPVYDTEGNDVCAELASKGKFRVFKRTTGVSTTDIIGKLLSLTKSLPNHEKNKQSRSNSL